MNHPAIIVGLLLLITIPAFMPFGIMGLLLIGPLLFFGLAFIFIGLLLPGRMFRPGSSKLVGSPFKSAAFRDLYMRQRSMVLRACAITSSAWILLIVLFLVDSGRRTGYILLFALDNDFLFTTLVLVPIATGMSYLTFVLRSLHRVDPSFMPESLANDFFMAFSCAFIVYLGVFLAKLWVLGLLFIYISGLLWIFGRRTYPTELLAYYRPRPGGRPRPGSFIETEETARKKASGTIAKCGLLVLLCWPLVAVLLYATWSTGFFIGGSLFAVMLLGGLLVGLGLQRIFPRFVHEPFVPEVVALRKRRGRIAVSIVFGLFILWDGFFLFFMLIPGLRSSAIALVWLLNALLLVPIGGAFVYFGLLLRSVHMVKYPKVKAELARNMELASGICLLFLIVIYITDLWVGGFVFLAYALFFWAIIKRSYKDNRKGPVKGALPQR